MFSLLRWFVLLMGSAEAAVSFVSSDVHTTLFPHYPKMDFGSNFAVIQYFG